MANRVQKARKPYKLPQWLIDASKKRSGVPAPLANEAFLDKLQYARTHPEEIERRAREGAIRSGRDPDTFARLMTETRNNAPPVELAQRPKQTAVEVEAVLDTGTCVEDMDVASTGKPTNPTSTERLQAVRKDKRNEKKVVARKKPKRSRPSRASGTASPMEVHSPQPAAESSASGALHETTAVRSDTTTATQTVSHVSTTVAQSYPYPTRLNMPKWYISISATAQGLAQLDRKRPQEITAIDALKNRITRCEQEKNKAKLDKEYDELRNEVHKAEIKLNMDKFKVKKTRILTDSGLPRIFGMAAWFPWDLKADAWYLYERWMNEDFEQNILRGIVTVKGKDRNGDRLDATYRAKHPRDPKFFGDDGVILGQWWPSQLCTVRDGVHGAAQGGIYGDKDKGAYSIVLSGGGYHDQDDGDSIEYSGTDGKDFDATDATLSMIKSAELGNHIRVIRSSQLKKANRYRPSCGLRYDGLYQIKSYRELDNEKRTYRFHLERVPGQEPIRFEGVTRRPTVFEEDAYDRCKGKL